MANRTGRFPGESAAFGVHSRSLERFGEADARNRLRCNAQDSPPHQPDAGFAVKADRSGKALLISAS
jgi:hypothetical protein